MAQPELFQNPNKVLTNLSQLITGSIINEAGVQALDGGADGVQTQPKYLQVTAHRAANHGLLDLKPYFAASAKAKPTKDGGWYLVVPIRRKVSSMSRKLYDQVRQISPLNTTANVGNLVNDYLNEGRKSSISLLNYHPTGTNITRIANPNGSGSQYVMFRTVSSKSDPASWIMNRNQARQENMSKTLLNNIEHLIRYRLSHLGEDRKGGMI